MDQTQVPVRLEAGQVLGGRYRLEEMIGTGGMAMVWRARDETIDRTVAIKMMSDVLAADPAYLTRFRREAQLTARISHPNLVTIYTFEADGPRPYLVMQYIEGGTLADRLSSASLDPPELAQIAEDLLAALEAVHSQDVLHRDVKPSNVLLGSDGRAHLTDFGIAQLLDATRLTQPGHLVGTLRFLAPELARGEDPTPRSDLFSLGVLLRECSGGSTPAPVVALIDRLADPDPARRPASAGEALARLRAMGSPDATVALDDAAGLDPTVVLDSASGLDATAPLDMARSPARAPTGTAQTQVKTATRARPRPQSRPRPRPSARARPRAQIGAGLLLVLAALIVLVLLLSGGSSHNRATAQPASGAGAHLTLDQRLTNLQDLVHSAPGR